MLINEIARYQDYFGEEPLELAVIVLGLVGGLWMALRGSYPARLILARPAVRLRASSCVAVSTKSKYYMLLTYPLYLLLLARVLERVAAWVATRRWMARPRSPPFASPLACGAGRGTEVYSRLSARRPGGSVMVWPLKLDERAWDNYIRPAATARGRSTSS